MNLCKHYIWELLDYTMIKMFYLLHVVLVEQLKQRESEHFAVNKMKMLKSKTFFVSKQQTISFRLQTLDPTVWQNNL